MKERAKHKGFNGVGPDSGEGQESGAGEVLESKRVEVMTTPAQLLRVIRRHEGEVTEDVEIRLVS